MLCLFVDLFEVVVLYRHVDAVAPGICYHVLRFHGLCWFYVSWFHFRSFGVCMRACGFFCLAGLFDGS